MDTTRAIIPCPECDPSEFFSTQCPGGTWDEVTNVEHTGAKVIGLTRVGLVDDYYGTIIDDSPDDAMFTALVYYEPWEVDPE